MTNHRTLLLGALAGLAALTFSSCAYDPYYTSSSYSYGYSDGGYGDGYGYGGSNFRTSIFVSTGSPRWGYDPYARCYYDYHRRAYYDPYLYGYYPVGYRPRYVHGAPHPHNWRKGRDYIEPPSRIHSRQLDNYRNRGERYRGLDRDWSNQVRVDTGGRDQRSGFRSRDSDGRNSFLQRRQQDSDRDQRMRSSLIQERSVASQPSVSTRRDRSAELLQLRQAQGRQDSMQRRVQPRVEQRIQPRVQPRVQPQVPSRSERSSSSQRSVVPQRAEMRQERGGAQGPAARGSASGESARRGVR